MFMCLKEKVAMDALIAMLRAAGDPTRLRLLLLLREAELTVSELIEIVGQSQPRVSRHLKLLGEAGLVERFKEGSWVFCRAADRGTGAELGAAIAALADPALQEADKARLAHVRQVRANAAAAYFKSNAAGRGAVQWRRHDRIRRWHFHLRRRHQQQWQDPELWSWRHHHRPDGSV